MQNTITQAPSLTTTRQIQRLRDLTPVHTWLKILLWSGVAVLVLSIMSGWLELNILADVKNGFDISPAEAEASDSRQGLIGLVQIFLFLTTAIFFLRFTYRTCQNAHSLTTTRVNFTPGWSVGWYFVPFANLYQPYRVMEEIYRISENPHADLKQRASVSIVNGWWALWMVSAFLGQYIFRTSMAAETPDELYHASMMTLVSDIIDIPLYLVVIVMIGRIFDMQMRRARGFVI